MVGNAPLCGVAWTGCFVREHPALSASGAPVYIHGLLYRQFRIPGVVGMVYSPFNRPFHDFPETPLDLTGGVGLTVDLIGHAPLHQEVKI